MKAEEGVVGLRPCVCVVVCKCVRACCLNLKSLKVLTIMIDNNDVKEARRQV